LENRNRDYELAANQLYFLNKGRHIIRIKSFFHSFQLSPQFISYFQCMEERKKGARPCQNKQ